MRNPKISRRTALALAGVSFLPVAAQAAGEVDLALVLAIDCSYSVDDYDYRLQLRGTGQALVDSAFLELIEHGAGKVIAVCAFLWSSPDSQQIIVPWRVLRNGNETTLVADEILAARRTLDAGATATGNALLFAENLFGSAPPALRRVVDVSTNGHCNMGEPVQPIRDRLVARGITINGLAVTDQVPNLVDYMVRDVIGGEGSFVIPADNYNAYTLAIRRKLFREVAGLKPV